MNHPGAQKCARLVSCEQAAATIPLTPIDPRVSREIADNGRGYGVDLGEGQSRASSAEPGSATVESVFVTLNISTPVTPQLPLSMPTVTTITATSSDPGARDERSLFYSLVMVLTSLSCRQRWRSYITGTSFTMRQVLRNASASLKLRTEVDGCAPIHRFRVVDMEFVLNHYFNLPGDFIDDSIKELLQQFEGRAVLFVALWRVCDGDEVVADSNGLEG